jgi:hypothetical protein
MLEKLLMSLSDNIRMRKLAIIMAGVLSSFSFAAFGQTQLIGDGDFESPIFSPPWTISGTGATVGSTAGFAHGGTKYLSLGNVATAAPQSAFQTITIPSNAVAATLTYYYNILSPGASAADLFEVLIIQSGGAFTVLDERSGQNTDGAAGGNNYHLKTFDLEPYAGQTVNIAFEAQDSTSGSGTSFNVDDVSVVVELPADVPANDYFTNRTGITGNPAILFGKNVFATKEPGEPNHANNAGGKSLWWSWTAPTNGVVQINTVGSTFTALLAAYDGSSISNLTRLAANNGANGDGNGRISFGVAAQTEVQIAVDGYNDGSTISSGSVVLNLSFKADTNRPTVAITSPAANSKVTGTSVTVQGTATDNLAVGVVQYRLENAAGTNDYQNATGTNHWSAIVSNLIAGPNTVRVRAFDTSSNLSTTVARTFTYVLTAPLDLSTTGAGHVSPNYSNALLEIGGTYTLTATPTAGSIFSNWTGTISAITPKLTFTMQSNMVLQASFVPNPFTPVKGNYAGLFYDTNGITLTNAGYFSAALADKGTFSSKWQFAGATYSLAGAFSADGTFSNAIARRGLSPLNVQLQMDFTGAETITGTISDGIWTAQLAANRAHFSKTTPAPQSGSYTLVIPGSDDSSTQPGGDGAGALKVDTSGNITFTGTLGDGTKVSQHTFLSKDGQWPLFVSLYAKQGFLIGRLTFDTNQADTDLSGFGSWIKAPQSGSKLYPAGFTLGPIALVGSKYSFTKGVPLVSWSNGQIVLAHGDLPDSITNNLSIDLNNKITGTNKLVLSFTPTTGLFHGSVLNPDTGKPITVNGALLQKQDTGYGYFLGTDQSGSMTLESQ